MYYEQLTAEQKVIVSERVKSFMDHEINPLMPRHRLLNILEEQLIEKHSAVERFNKQQADLMNTFDLKIKEKDKAHAEQIENLKRQIANLSR